MINHPNVGLTDVFAATIPTLDFAPTIHVDYLEAVLPMSDGLPKYEDFPSEFGGLGKLVSE